MQPIVVRPVAGGRYQVIAGERRWEAVRQLRHRSIAAIVRPVSNEQAMEMTIVENLQRLELTCMEQARGYDQLAREFALTQEEMAERTGKQRSSVANFLRLLKLSSSVQAMLDKGQLSFGHAKVLMALESAEEVEQPAQHRPRQGDALACPAEWVHRMRGRPVFQVLVFDCLRRIARLLGLPIAMHNDGYAS